MHDNNFSDETFIVMDGKGNEWARYCFRPMAERVAERNNGDAGLRSLQPFRVERRELEEFVNPWGDA